MWCRVINFRTHAVVVQVFDINIAVLWYPHDDEICDAHPGRMKVARVRTPAWLPETVG